MTRRRSHNANNSGEEGKNARIASESGSVSQRITSNVGGGYYRISLDSCPIISFHLVVCPPSIPWSTALLVWDFPADTPV